MELRSLVVGRELCSVLQGVGGRRRLDGVTSVDGEADAGPAGPVLTPR